MRFEQVRIASLAYDLPAEVVTSAALEERLAPLYERLALRAGRLELMTGIRERRFYPAGARPSAIAAAAGERALELSGLARERIGALVHASVCRDFLEPATATVVHHALRLPSACACFDLSNACLGFASALVVQAGAIERGAIDAALVVAGENARPLVEATLESLLADPRAGKAELKRAFASLTIGAGGAAAVLARAELAPLGMRLLGGAELAATEHHALCREGRGSGPAGPLMETDSEALLLAGNALAARTWELFLTELSWGPRDIQRVVTHQVGAAHRRLLFETLSIDPALDFPTVETLGNIGSVSLPLTLARARESGFIRPGERVALLGIASGLSCQMLGLIA